MADFMGMIKQAAQLQSKMQELQAELDHIEVEGAAGGSLEIYAKVQVLDGSIIADTIVGERQVRTPPAGGSLAIGAMKSFQAARNAKRPPMRKSWPGAKR